MSRPSITETLEQINNVCHQKGGKYSEYSCKTVSWDDVNRGTVGGSLSCWGGNITDTYLKSKDGETLFTVRSDNWNEKLGHVSTEDVALIQGNQSYTSSDDDDDNKKELKPITLKTFLENCLEYGGYAGLDESENLSNIDLDSKISIRFQTTFLPVENTDKGHIEFCTESYNYNTTDDEDPRNLILLCTTQGIALQQDGAGTKQIFHHNVNENGQIDRYWLEAERSKHKVGGSQVETEEEKKDAISRGKAVSDVIGIKAMGNRFNVLMTVQIPLAKKKKGEDRPLLMGGGDFMCYSSPMMKCMPMAMECMALENCDDYLDEEECYTELEECAESISRSIPEKELKRKTKTGTANAARVSRGTKKDTWPGLSISDPKRNDQEHLTVTIVNYFTIAGGVPSEEDIVAAIDDMEMLYDACDGSGKLGDSKFDFMKNELTVQDCIDISKKVTAGPSGK